MSNIFLKATKNKIYIKECLDKYLSKYEKINYAYFLLDKRNLNNIVVISDLSDYFYKIYLKKNHQHIDPIIINSLNRVSPLIWDDTIMINHTWKLSEIFDSVKTYHDIISGQTFILHCPDNKMALLSLYVNKYLIPEVNTNITKDKDEIQGMLINIYENFMHLYNKKCKNTHFSELTFREKEALYWASLGKTYSEIAVILNISTSTVKFHMSNVTKKLSVKNAKHAIKVSVELNLIADVVA